MKFPENYVDYLETVSLSLLAKFEGAEFPAHHTVPRMSTSFQGGVRFSTRNVRDCIIEHRNERLRNEEKLIFEDGHPDNERYEAAVAWIAENDNPGDPGAKNADEVEMYVSVKLIADMFEVAASNVAMSVVLYRERHH